MKSYLKNLHLTFSGFLKPSEDQCPKEERLHYASNAGLMDGYEYKAIDLLYGLMLPSGCDCADVLAKYVGDGSVELFVQKMNNKAKALGMNNTNKDKLK